MNTVSRNTSGLAGRILMATIFLIAGAGKIGAYAGTQGYMQAHGVPGALLPAVIALEIGGGLLIVAGAWTRVAALALAAFSLLAALIFHANFADAMQQINFLKNLAIAGGFLILAANGAGAWSVDARRAAPKGTAIAEPRRATS